MTLKEDILEAKKKKRLVFGSKQSLKAIKDKSASLVILSENCQESVKRDITHYAKIAKTEIKTFKDSKELGIICGKPFVISVLTILK